MLGFLRNIRPYWCQFIAIFSASFGLISNGMEYGWASPAVPKLSQLDSPIPAFRSDASATSWVETIYIVGCVCGTPVTFLLLQYAGRRRAIMASEATALICWVLVATADNLPQLYVARFFSGLASNVVYVGVPMYTAEVSQAKVRGFFGAVMFAMNMLGLLVAYSVVPYTPIYASSALGSCICLIMLIAFFFQPESPYFLLTKQKHEEARRALQQVRSASEDDLTAELKELIVAVDRQQKEKSNVLDLIRVPSNRKATLIMMLLNAAQNLAGLSVVVMNAQTLLKKASDIGGIEPPLSDATAAVTFASTMLAAGIFGAFLIDCFGRRFLLITSAILSSICLALLSAYYTSPTYFPSWLPLFSLVSYAFAFKSGLGLVPIVVTGELFPTSVKAMGMVLADLWFTVLATVSLVVYHATEAKLGPQMAFGFFSGCAGMTAVLVWAFIPETKGKTLEEIQQILKGEKVINDKKEDIN